MRPSEAETRRHDPAPPRREGTESSRDIALDVLRGIAICLMVQNQVAVSLLGSGFPTWAEIYVMLGSFAPALFVMLAGMGVVRTSLYRRYALKHFLLRAFFLAITAALVVDVAIWRSMPFVSAEILYLIALSLPVAYLFQKLRSPLRWGVIAAIVVLTPLLQHAFGYTPFPTDLSLSGIPTRTSSALNTTGIVQHWTVDGWFPIFPWLGVALLGVNIGLMRWDTKQAASFATPRFIALGTILLVVGISLWVVTDTHMYNRGGFRELIFPPTIAYLLTAIGQIVLLACLIDWRPNLRLYRPLIVFGEASLFMYWFHLLVAELLPFRTDLSGVLGAILLASLVFFLGFAYVIRTVRKRFPGRSPLFKYVLGI